MSAPFPKPDRSNKPTVAETVEEFEVERRAGRTGDTIRHAVFAAIVVATFVFGVSRDSWTFVGILWAVLLAVLGVRQLMIRRARNRLLDARRRTKETT